MDGRDQYFLFHTSYSEWRWDDFQHAIGNERGGGSYDGPVSCGTGDRGRIDHCRAGGESSMLRAIALFMAVCGMASATAYTASQTGNWASSSTWGGAGVPGAGDTATVSCACTVTVAASTTAIIGNSPAANTTVLTISPSPQQNASKVSVAGTLTLHGDVMIGESHWLGNALNGVLEVQGDGIVQFESPSTVAYAIRYFPENDGIPFPQVTSTATSWSHPAIIRTIPGNVGVNGSIETSCCDSSINLTYTKLVGLGTSSHNAMLIEDYNFNHVALISSGQLNAFQGINLPSFASNACFDYFTNPLPLNTSVAINVGGPFLPTGTCNHVKDSVIYGNTSLEWSNMTWTNTIFTGSGFQVVAPMNTFTNVLIAGLTSSIPGFQPSAHSGFRWNGGGFWVNPASGNPHMVTDNTSTTGNNVPNMLTNIAVDGSASTVGDGDLWVSPDVHYVTRVIENNGAGNMDDGTGASTAFGYLNHNTSEATIPTTGQSVISLQEFGLGNQIQQTTNMLSDRNYNTACITVSFNSYVPLTAWNYDYNWISNAPARGGDAFGQWNSATNHFGGHCPGFSDLPFATGTVTVSSITDANHIVVSSTAGIGVGASLYYAGSQTSAMVTAVPSSGHVTLGNDEFGAAGIAGITNGVTLSILPNYWSSGQYGDTGKGQHEAYSDPKIINTNATVVAWDKANEGPGTFANALGEAVKFVGWDSSGNAAAFNPAYCIQCWQNFVKKGTMPTSLALKGWAHDTRWAANTVYQFGVTVLDANRHLQLCVVGGTSGSSEPAWNDSAPTQLGTGGLTTDGTAQWEDQLLMTDPGAVQITSYNVPGIGGGGVF